MADRLQQQLSQSPIIEESGITTPTALSDKAFTSSIHAYLSVPEKVTDSVSSTNIVWAHGLVSAEERSKASLHVFSLSKTLNL